MARSRLSQEILLTGLFALAALLYSTLWVAGTAPLRQMIGAMTAAFGVLAVVASARVYLLPGQPFWNAAWLPVSFAGTTLLLGGCAGLMVRAGGASAFRLLLGATVSGGVLSLVSALWMAAHLTRLRGQQSAGPRLDLEPTRLGHGHWLTLGIHLLMAAAVPSALLLHFGFASAPGLSTTFSAAAFCCVLLGAVLGRVLMYPLPASLSRF